MGKIYFASDFHLGADASTNSRVREKWILSWLQNIQSDAEVLYLLGDVFDFWFEYSKVVPKGYVRLMGSLAEMRDNGLPIYFFTGNHDMWIFRYFEDELGIPTFRSPQILTLQGTECMIGHGDGLGPGDHGYKLLKKVFANPACQWLFERIHPNLGIRIAEYWSGKSRYANQYLDVYTQKEAEWLYQYCESVLSETNCQYYIFGHRHIPIDLQLSNGKSRYINTGEWMYSRSYAFMENGHLELAFFENEDGKIHYS
jgi:UDP-2,3-diacylglucosamine hydrolase